MSYQREFARRLRVGIVGVGDHAYRNILPALHYLPVELVAMCDLNASLLESTAREYGVPRAYTDSRQMYAEANLDAMLICVGPRVHADLTIEALQAGLHVWVEKPPAMRARDIARIEAARGDRICAVGFKKAYMPVTRKAKELIAEPGFGQLRSLLAVYPMTIPQDGQRVLESGQYHNWLANGCHPLSFMIAVGGLVRDVTTLRGPGEDAVGVVYLQFEQGAAGVLHLAGGAPQGQPIERYDLFGEGHSISIENSVKISYHRGVPFDYRAQTDFTGAGTSTGTVSWEADHALATLENKGIFVQGIFDELLDFCSAVLEERSLNVADLEFAGHVMEVYEAALISNGQPVKVS